MTSKLRAIPFADLRDEFRRASLPVPRGYNHAAEFLSTIKADTCSNTYAVALARRCGFSVDSVVVSIADEFKSHTVVDPVVLDDTRNEKTRRHAAMYGAGKAVADHGISTALRHATTISGSPVEIAAQLGCRLHRVPVVVELTTPMSQRDPSLAVELPRYVGDTRATAAAPALAMPYTVATDAPGELDGMLGELTRQWVRRNGRRRFNPRRARRNARREGLLSHYLAYARADRVP